MPASSGPDVPPGRGRGRPPSSESSSIEEGILDAAVAEIIETGFTGLTIERIAQRAGVARTTVYHRWSDANHLGADAVARMRHVRVDVPQGEVTEQLLWLVEQVRVTWSNPRTAALMRRVVGEANRDPELFDVGRERVAGAQVRTMTSVIRRGQREGVLRADVPAAWIQQMLVGPILASALLKRPTVTSAHVRQLVDALLRGLAPAEQ